MPPPVSWWWITTLRPWPRALDGVPDWTRVQAEAIAFLVRHLGDDGRWDWIIPMVPVHVAFHWLLAGPLAGSGWQPEAVPEALAGLIPGARRGPKGRTLLEPGPSPLPG